MPKVNKDDAVKLVREIRKLMQLNGENPFKIRAFDRAEEILADVDDLVERVRDGSITELKGIGKGIYDVLSEFVESGESSVLDELESQLPEGLLELVQIPGLGPKKARTIIDELQVTSIGELEYACRENRLLSLKGFGEKAQKKILEQIEFFHSTQGQARLVDALPWSEEILSALKKAAGKTARVEETGPIRRRLEVVQSLDFLVSYPSTAKKDQYEKKVWGAVQKFQDKEKVALEVNVSFAEESKFEYEWARTTATPEHWKALGEPPLKAGKDEKALYIEGGGEWISPEMRETGEEVRLGKKGQLSKVLPWDGIRGVFHNHTTYSDGAATVEQMVAEAERLGYEYIGLSDHSQTAFYAQGIQPKDLKRQEREVREAQEKHPNIRVFWGIESDILKDGSLDYKESDLKRFDFVIASIHSRYGMTDKKEMTERLLTAIRNPYTRFVGHVTGRLLLGRKGYEVDMDQLIEEATQYGVSIELNSNPARLDIDWRHGKALRKNQTWVSVNPDAHTLEGLQDTRWGVIMARKALLPQSQVINAQSVEVVEKWLAR